MGASVSLVDVSEALEELKDCRKIKTLDDEFWSIYWTLKQMTLQDMLETVTIEQIRDCKVMNRSNFKTLCLYCMSQIHTICQSSLWKESDTIHFNNCIIWLVRIFPVILEDREMINYLWEGKSDANQQSYALNLIQDITESLFRPGYTVSKFGELYTRPDSMNTCLIWKPGLVISEFCETTDVMLENRKNLLSLLLLILSQELYFTYEESVILGDKFSAWFKSKKNKFAVLIFTSLINNVICTANEQDSARSYSRTFKKSEELLFFCLHILMLMVGSTNEELEEEYKSKECHNTFIDIIQGIHKKEDIDMIITALHLLLKSSTIAGKKSSANYYVSFHQECLVLLWRFCMINQKFINYLLISPHMPSIMLNILLYLYEAINDPSEIGFLHTSLSLLLFLSSERQFALIMNTTYDGKPYYDLTKNCSYNDYLIYCLAKLMTKGSDNLSTLYETIASIVFNISPYMSLVTMSAGLTMICMLETAVKQMLVNGYGGIFCKVVCLLLDSFNNVLCFGYNINSHLIFCMILSHKVFYKVHVLSSETENSNYLLDDDLPLDVPDNNALWMFSTKNIIKFLDILVPQVEKMCEETDCFDEEKVTRFLKRSTIVGIINKPSQILTRRFEVMESVIKWIHIYTWTIIYLKQNDLQLYQGSDINLFKKSA